MEINNDLTQLGQEIDQKLAQEKKSRLPWRLIMVGVGITIGISALVAAAFAAGMKFSGINSKPAADSQQLEEPTPTPDPTLNWKEYATPWYSLKIPPRWHQVEENQDKSGIILVTNNLDYADFGNVKSGALIYVPVGPADESILDTLLSENLKRGYKLVSKQPLQPAGVAGTEIVMDSPLGSRETQFRFLLTDKTPAFLSLVSDSNEKDLYYQEFHLMLSTLKLKTPQNLSHFSHPDGLFQVNYPAEMKIEKTERALTTYENAQDWEFASASAAVTLSVEPFRSRSVQDEAKARYQKVVTQNRVGAVFSTVIISGKTALQYTELTPEGKRLTKIYLDLPGDFILTVLYYDEVEAKQAAETILNSLRMP